MPVNSVAAGPFASALALPSPLSTEAPNGPANFAALTLKLEQTVGYDTGWTTFAYSSAFNVTTGNSYAFYRRIGALVTVAVNVVTNVAFTGGHTNFATKPGQGLPNAVCPNTLGAFQPLTGSGVYNDTGVFRWVIAESGDIDFYATTTTINDPARFCFHASYPIEY